MLRLFQAPARLFSRNVWLFLISAFLVGFGFDGGVVSVLFNLYMLRLGFGPELVGVVNSAGLFAFALFSLPAGFFGNWWGIKRMVVVGLVILIIGGVLLTLTEALPPEWRVAWLVMAYSIVFLGMSLYFVNGAPFMMASSEPARRDHLFSVQTGLMATAAFIGSLIGGALPALFAELLDTTLDFPAPYRYPLLLATLIIVPALLLIATAEDVEANDNEEQPVGREPDAPAQAAGPLPMGLFLLLLLVRLLQVCGVATLFVFFNVYLDTQLQTPTSTIGLVSAAGRLIAVPVALLTPFLTRKWGNLNVVVLSCVIVSLGYLPLAFVPSVGAAAVGYVAVVGLSAMRYPAFMNFSMRIVAPRQRGTLTGAGEMAAGIAFTGLALGGGFMVARLSYESLFNLTSLLNIAGALLFWYFFRDFRRKKSERTPTPVAPQAPKAIDSPPV